MRGLKRLRSAARIAAGHALVQNLRRGHYELATDVPPPLRLPAAFSELRWLCDLRFPAPDACPARSTQQTHRNPANADRSTWGRAARGRRTPPSLLARPDHHPPRLEQCNNPISAGSLSDPE